jgi:hypothetical protein
MVSADGQQVFVASSSATASTSDFASAGLEIRDAATFALQQTVAIPGEGPDRQFFPSPDRRWLVVLRSGGPDTTLHLFNVATRQFDLNQTLRSVSDQPVFSGVWDTGGSLFYATDGERLLAIDANRQYLASYTSPLALDQDAGTPFTLAAARGGRVTLYFAAPPDGTPSAAPGGLFIVNDGGKLIERWKPENHYAQVIAQAGRLYAVFAARGDDYPQMVIMDVENGDVLARWGLERYAWRLASAWIDPDLIGTGGSVRLVGTCH